MKTYRKEMYCTKTEKRFRIISGNGVPIAICKTEAMADKIIKGLELVEGLSELSALSRKLAEVERMESNRAMWDSKG